MKKEKKTKKKFTRIQWKKLIEDGIESDAINDEPIGRLVRPAFDGKSNQPPANRRRPRRLLDWSICPLDHHGFIFTDFYLVLPSYTEFYLVLPSFT